MISYSMHPFTTNFNFIAFFKMACVVDDGCNMSGNTKVSTGEVNCLHLHPSIPPLKGTTVYR